MTAEQLEELASGVNPAFMGLDHDEVITSLARRVLAAEKMVDALTLMRDTTNRAGMYDFADTALTAYRESSK